MPRSVDDLVATANKTESEIVKILRRENAKLRKQLERDESGWDLIRSVLEDVYAKPSDLSVRRPRVVKKKQVEVGVLHLTDYHFGKKTADYNCATAALRLIELFDAVSAITLYRRKFAGLNKCLLLLGGDMLEGGGNIFPSQPHELDADIISQMLKEGPESVANLVLSLAGLFKSIEVYAVNGNHGVVSRFGNQKHNADAVFYEVVRAMVEKVEARRTKWDLPLDREVGWRVTFPIIGRHQGLLIHGDNVRGGFAGYPWYGVGRKAMGWRTSSETAGFNHLWLGHFHTPAAFRVNDMMIMAGGTVESSNEYALCNMASGGPPSQRFSVFNSKYGIVADHLIQLQGDARES